MPLELNYPIAGLKGATYNPRKITAEDETRLDTSLSTLGLVKPIIARGDTIVAGHQRTKALKRAGVTHAAVYLLSKDVNVYDEVRFNQLHNGTDLDMGGENVTIEGAPLALGFQTVAPDLIHGNALARGAIVRTEIAQLIIAYGPWGCSVATESGQVIHAAQYALTARLTRTPLTLFVVPDERAEEYAAALGHTYGVFSYDHLQRDTYIQSLAQMYRLRASDKGEGLKSTLYEQLVLPWLADHPDAEMMDFGSGQGDYAKMLRGKGFSVSEIELFRRAKTVRAIDLSSVRRMVSAMASRVAGGRLYDAVVCDSVLNSVDSMEAEASVMTMLNALVPIGAPVFLSGRKREASDGYMQLMASRNHRRYLEFFDENNFTVLYRDGHWFYQKLHTEPQIRQMCERYGLEIVKHVKSAVFSSWQTHAVKVRELSRSEVIDAIDFEFNLPISRDQRLGMSEKVRDAFAPRYPTDDPN